jgi:hypothetical protein
MDVTKFVSKLILVTPGIINIVNLVKGADDKNKRDAIGAAIGLSVSLAEFAAEKDLLNDENVGKLYQAYLDAEHAVAKAREALKASLLAAKAVTNK